MLKKWSVIYRKNSKFSTEFFLNLCAWFFHILCLWAWWIFDLMSLRGVFRCEKTQLDFCMLLPKTLLRGEQGKMTPSSSSSALLNLGSASRYQFIFHLVFWSWFSDPKGHTSFYQPRKLSPLSPYISLLNHEQNRDLREEAASLAEQKEKFEQKFFPHESKGNY